MSQPPWKVFAERETVVAVVYSGERGLASFSSSSKRRKPRKLGFPRARTIMQLNYLRDDERSIPRPPLAS